jgi:hypothetical protein
LKKSIAGGSIRKLSYCKIEDRREAEGALSFSIQASIQNALEAAFAEPAPESLDIRAFNRCFADVRWAVKDVITAADKAAFPFEASGLSREFGRRVSWQGSGIARLRKGAVVEFEIRQDPWSWRIQEGLLPAIATDSLAGEWTGEVYGLPFRIVLENGREKNRFHGFVVSEERKMEVAASHDHPWANIASGDGLFLFTGRWLADDLLEGAIERISEAVQIRRVSAACECSRVFWPARTAAGAVP